MTVCLYIWYSWEELCNFLLFSLNSSNQLDESTETPTSYVTRFLTVSSASRSHSGCVSRKGILSHPFHSMTIGPPIPEVQFDLENSRSNVKVKGTLVSAVSSWLIFLLFHNRAPYRTPSLSFHYNRVSHSRDTIWPCKLWQNSSKN